MSDTRFHTSATSSMKIDFQETCGNNNWVNPPPLVDFLDFSTHIHGLKKKMMVMLNLHRDNYFVFQYRSEDFGENFLCFSVACTRFYTPLCRSVCRAVGPSVCWSVCPSHFTFLCCFLCCYITAPAQMV